MDRLRERIRQLPPGVEFLFVVVCAFGLSIFTSILSIGGLASRPTYVNATLLGTTLEVLIVAALLGGFLRIRDWSLERIGFEVTLRQTIWGVGLLAGVLGVQTLLQVSAPLLGFHPGAPAARFPAAAALDPGVVLIASVVQDAFEEFFIAGYVITALAATRGPWAAVHVSTGLRVLCHVYQGPLGVLTMVPMGLIFGYLYVRTRKLWPLIVAHLLLDVIALALASR